MKKEKETENAVIYARYSSSGQRDESIEGQLRDCHDYAERYHLNVVGEYCDRALTGTSDKRPEFQRMIRDSAKGNFSVVITWKNDRFARSRYDSAIYKCKLKQNGVRLVYAKESIPEGPEGIILESVLEGFAEYYSANLSQNVKRGNYDSALKRQTLGQTVLGYRTGADKRFEIDPETAPIVKRIFHDYIDGKPSIEIVNELNSEGYKTTQGNPFNKNAIRRILQNEKYYGVYTFLDIIRDENGIPPIIDKDTFDKAQKMLDIHHRTPALKIKREDAFMLTTKLFCGECGSPMGGDSGTSKTGKVYYYYTCLKKKGKECDMLRVNKELIENAVIDALVNFVSSDGMIQKFSDRYMKWQEEQTETELVISLREDIKKIESAINNALELVDSGVVSSSLKSHLVSLESEKAAKQKALAKAEFEMPKLERESIVWFLERFRNGDKNDIKYRTFLIDAFLKAAYLFSDGRLILCLNFGGDGGGGKKIDLKLAKKALNDGEILGSDLESESLPNGAKSNAETTFFVEGMLFLGVLAFAK